MRPDSDAVNIITEHVRRALSGRPEMLYEAATHIVKHGGKRIRPYMVIETCQMMGGDKTDALDAAAAVEMIHNFSLVHDDIMDNDDTRHGVPTTHEKYGISLAILAGDTLFSKAYSTLATSSLPTDIQANLIGRLAMACVDICEGQWMDISMGLSQDIPQPAKYVEMIRKKTSALFGVSCVMGAICARAKPRDVSVASSFGINMGTAFQITDDLIGIIGDPEITKKPVGNDLREGKKSLPILMALESADDKQRNIIMRAFGNAGATVHQTNEAVDTIRNLGIEDTVRDRAASYADAARRALTSYSNVHSRNLESLLEFVVKRRL